MWYFITWRGSDVCHITRRSRKGKGLEVPCKYMYYYGSTKNLAFIRDQVFSFIIMLFLHPLNKTKRLYETGHNLRQYGTYVHTHTYVHTVVWKIFVWNYIVIIKMWEKNSDFPIPTKLFSNNPIAINLSFLVVFITILSKSIWKN